MAKWASPEYLDGSLLVIQGNATRMAATEGQPLVLTEVTNPKGVADGKRITDEITMAGGDFPISNGTPDGRQIDVAAKSDVPVATGVTGTPDHTALYSPTVLYYATTNASPPTVDDTFTLSFATWAIRNRAPV